MAAVECSGHGAWLDNGWVDDGCYTAVRLVTELAVMRWESKARGLGDSSVPTGVQEEGVREEGVREEVTPLCRLSDLLVGLEEPEESLELRFRVKGGPTEMSRVTARALQRLREVAGSGDVIFKEGSNSRKKEGEGNTSGGSKEKETVVSSRWKEEPVNYEGLRVNFEFDVWVEDEVGVEEVVKSKQMEEKGRLVHHSGWCMLRASLHEPILSLQMESDFIGK